MSKLTWFKFTPSDYMMGKIQRCSEITQARFIRLCCLYWNKQCELTYEDAEIEIDKEHIDILISKRVVVSQNGIINISFLDEQFAEIEGESEGKKTSGIIGNLKRWHREIYDQYQAKKISLEQAVELSKLPRKPIADPSHPDSTPIADPSQSIAEKKRTEQIRLEEEENRTEYNNLDVPTKVETPPKKKVLFTECSMLDFEPKDQNSFEIAKGFWQLFGKNLKEIGAPLANIKKANAKEWTRQIALMLKNEEATVDQLREVYDFLKVDEFWKPNVQSVPKLREKFTTIYSQSKKIKNESNSKGTGGASDAFKRRIFETLTGQTSNS